MIKIKENNKKDCCGCGACSQICPAKCIEMKQDKEGFLYPLVNEKLCVECGMCESVCPVLCKSSNGKQEERAVYEEPKAYGGWHMDDAIRTDSSSGGTFTLLAEYILKKKGIVFGCALNEDMKAVHIGIDSEKELWKLRGSKYVQSEIGDVYREVKGEVEKGRFVLFVGSPCQVAGLNGFLGKKYGTLYTIDFICHGVPSPAIFEAYMKELENREKSKIISFRFRNKDYGWNQSGLQLGTETKFENGHRIRKYPAFRDSFMNGFLDDIYLRPSCYHCGFKELPKNYADFTIADFWGVNKVNEELNDGRGTSLVLVHNEHAQTMWEQIEGGFWQEVGFDSAIKKNTALLQSVREHPRRRNFFDDFQEHGFSYVEKKYMSAFTWAIHKTIRMVWNKIGQFIKFGLVGISNTLISLAVYYLLVYFGVHYLIAYTLGFVISVCNAFYWNNKYVFRNKQEKSLVKAFLKVFASYGVSFFLSVILMTLLVEMAGISSLIAPVLKLIITIPLNFMLNKIWAFKDKRLS